MPIADPNTLPEPALPGKHKPIAETVPGKGKDIVQAAADQTVRQIQHEVRQQVFHAHDINMAISQRARELHPGLLAKAPSLAAELLLGSTKTADLGSVSHAAHDAWLQQQQEASDAQAQQFLDLGGPVVIEYAHKATSIQDKNQQALYMQFVQKAAELPLGHEKDAALQLLPTVFNLAQSGGLSPDQSLLQEVTGAVGKAIAMPITAPIGLLSKGTDITQAGLGNVGESNIPGLSTISRGLETGLGGIQAGAGAALHGLGAAAQFATRNVQAAVLYTPGHEDYFASWSGAQSGDHEPFSKFIAEHVLGTTADDPKYQGLFDVTDLSADLVTQVAMFKALSVIKGYRTLPDYAGGKLTGGDFVTKALGRRVGADITETLSKTVSEKPPGFSVDLVGQKLNKYGESIGDIPSKNITWVKTEDLYNNADLRLARTESAQPGSTMADYAKGLKTSKHFDRPVEVLVDGKRVEVVDGNHTLEAAKAAGVEYVPVYTVEPPVPGLGLRAAAEAGYGPAERSLSERLPDRFRSASGPVESARALLTDKYKNINASLADRLVRLGPSPTEAEVLRALAQHIDDRPTAQLPAVRAELDATRKALQDPELLVGQDMLRAKEAALTARVSELEAWDPIYEFPTKARMQAFMRGVPGGRVYRALQGFFGETGKVDLSKAADDLAPHNTRITDPTATVKHPGWAEDNANALRKAMNIRKVPKADQRALMEEMFRLSRDGGDTFQWGRDIEDALVRGDGKHALLPGQEELLHIWNRSMEERMQAPIEVSATLPDGTTVTELRNAFTGKDGSPLPTDVNEVAGSFKLPDMQLLNDVSSAVKRWDFYAKRVPVVGKIYGVARTPVDIARFVTLTLPRLILRPILLGTRAVLGALSPMGAKIQIDQGVRAFQVGYNPFSRTMSGPAAELLGKNPSMAELLPDEGVSAIGAVANEMAPSIDYVTMKMDTRFDPNLRPRDWELVGTARWEQLRKLNTGPLAKKVAALGPEEALRYLETHPDTVVGRWWADQKLKLDRAEVTPEQFLANKELEIVQAAGGDPALREAIATGEWHVGRDVPTGVGIERGMRADELVEARNELALTEDPIIRNEINLRIESIEHSLGWLDRNNPTGQVIKMSDERAVTGQLLTNARDGSYQMPKEVIVRKPTILAEVGEGKSILEKAQAAGQVANRQLYRSMKRLSEQDFTRRNTDRQVFNKVYNDLVEHGFSPQDALVRARYRAAGITKDLDYDISARSTLDRKLKETFWFAPVWREQMLTYLWKIPSRAYWPAGIVLTVGEAHSLLQGLKAIGILKDSPYTYKDPKTGKTVTESRLTMQVPWVSDFIAKALGNSAAGGISVEGFNPVTPGTSGALPTFSPGFEAIYDLTAKKVPASWKPFFDIGSRLFEFDKNVDQGPSFLPRALIATAELLGVHIPADTLSLDQWKQAYNKAETQSRRWAMSDLAADGILPPSPNAPLAARKEAAKIYKDASDTELSVFVKYGITPLAPLAADATDAQKAAHDEQQAVYDAAVKKASDAEMLKYRAQLEDRAQHYERTLAFVHVLGAVVLPGSAVTSTSGQGTGVTKAGAAYYKWRYETGPLAKDAIPYGTDEYLAAQNAYLKAHPAAWSYTVGTHSAGRPGDPVYGSAAYSSTTLDPTTYTQKALDQVHYWRDDEPTHPPVVPDDGSNFATLSPRRQQVALVNYATTPATDLTTEQLDALGLSDFAGRDALFKKLGDLETSTKNYIDKHPNLSADDEKRLYDLQNIQIAGLAFKYGQDGAEALRIYQGTPAQKLRGAHYFTSPTAELVIAGAGAIARHATANGASPMYASESAGVLQAKVDFYRKLELLRKTDSKFDADIRRAEIALHEKDRTAGRVATYEYLWFGQSANYFGYQDALVRALNAG